MSEKSTAGYQIFSLADAARTKGMWAGSLERTAIPGLCGAYEDGREAAYVFREIAAEHTPALLKIIDEGLVNASDHAREHADAKRKADRVTEIHLNFDKASGRFEIINDGPGIPVVEHAQASAEAGRPVYVPEVAFAHFLAGKNMDKDPASVKGGINGLGAKLINVNSAEFSVETVGAGADGKPRHYRQAFSDRLRVRGEPTILKKGGAAWKQLDKASQAPHTRICSLPAYADLGYGASLGAADAADLEAWCRWRMFLLAAYVGPKTAVVFNGARCPTTSAAHLARLAVAHDPSATVESCKVEAGKGAAAGHPWDVAVAVVPSASKFQQLSVINGVHCSKGSHTNHLKKLLAAAISDRVQKAAKLKKVAPADACKHVYLVAVGALPGADWGGQRKSELQVAESKVSGYAFPPAALRRIAAQAADGLLLATEKKVAGKKKRIEADKYTGARLAGTKDSAACSLLTAEGDSAISLLRAGLTLGAKKNPGGPSFERFGVISLRGVIMNALKKVSQVSTADGKKVVVRSEQLRNNKVLQALVDVLGLDFTCRYETDEEVGRLRYGAVIIATDQDLDGTGKILPLVLVWFHVFWPNLIARGFVKRYMTPVIRAYPRAKDARGLPAGKKAFEFFYENEFEHWAAGRDLGGVTVKYYKGLATHDDSEVADMFRSFHSDVYTFTLDDSAAGLFEVYFGDNPDLRKAALATPVRFLSYEEARELHRSHSIPCRVQLEVDAKAYKLDDIQRKIPGIADGVPVARRKVLAGALRRFAASNREVKVFQLGGYVAENMFYHHGDASLNSTIVGMAQRFPGALAYPFLSGIGQFGSRHFGGSDAGSARYINVRLAAPYARAVFPAEDTWMLPHVFEDGERAQPQYFLGVLPTALLESFEIPSEGWRHKSFGREVSDVLALLRAYVSGEVAAPTDEVRRRFPLRVSLRDYREENRQRRGELVRRVGAVLYSFGWYELERRARGRKEAEVAKIRVTELPLRKTTEAFLKDLEKADRKKYIESVDDLSSDTRVEIEVNLVPGGYADICAKFGTKEVDAVEDFLLLRASLRPFLNYYGTDGRVLEFGDDYHAVFFHWAPLRRDLYRQRLERESLILTLRTELERETVRFIESGIDLSAAASEEEATRLLEARGFSRFDADLIASPKFTPTEEVRPRAVGAAGARVSYAYLFNLRARELVVAAKTRRLEKISRMAEQLAAIADQLGEKPFAGASVWLAEIDKASEAIALGEKTNWKFS